MSSLAFVLILFSGIMLFLGESCGRIRLLASTLIFAGIFLIRLG